MADPPRLQRPRPLAPHRRAERPRGRPAHRRDRGGPQLHDPKRRAGAGGPAHPLGPQPPPSLRHRGERASARRLRRGVLPEAGDGREPDVLVVELTFPDPARRRGSPGRARREGGLRGGLRRGAGRARAPRQPGRPPSPATRATGAIDAAATGAGRNGGGRVAPGERRPADILVLVPALPRDRLAAGPERRGGRRRGRGDGDRPAWRAGGVPRRPRSRPAPRPGRGPGPAHRGRGQLHRRLLPHRVLRPRAAGDGARTRGGGNGDRRRLGGPAPLGRSARRLCLPAPRRLRHGADDGRRPRRPPLRPRRRRDGGGGAPQGHVRGVPPPPGAPPRGRRDGPRLRPGGRGRPPPLPVGGPPRRAGHRGDEQRGQGAAPLARRAPTT